MKIESSFTHLNSRHSLIEKDERRETVRLGKDAQPATTPGQSLLQSRQDSARISQQAVRLMRQKLREAESLAGPEQTEVALSDKDFQQISLLEMLLSRLTGKKVRFAVPDGRQARAIAADAGVLPGVSSLAGQGLTYKRVQTHYEAETTTFQADGLVKTADGREIAFSLDLTMSREFYSRQSLEVQIGLASARDPLVINFDGPSAGLTEAKIQFDLDADGTLDNLSFVRPGSGFLAWDQNRDGIINDGRELFGPQSGDGFADLALHDSDGNMWIDENDPIFSQLQIWAKDAEGKDQLLALGVAGIGAIYLGHVSTEFALKDSDNNQHGQIRSTGLFLRENGSVGTVQHVDLVV